MPKPITTSTTAATSIVSPEGLRDGALDVVLMQRGLFVEPEIRRISQTNLPCAEKAWTLRMPPSPDDPPALQKRQIFVSGSLSASFSSAIVSLFLNEDFVAYVYNRAREMGGYRYWRYSGARFPLWHETEVVLSVYDEGLGMINIFYGAAVDYSYHERAFCPDAIKRTESLLKLRVNTDDMTLLDAHGTVFHPLLRVLHANAWFNDTVFERNIFHKEPWRWMAHSIHVAFPGGFIQNKEAMGGMVLQCNDGAVYRTSYVMKNVVRDWLHCNTTVSCESFKDDIQAKHPIADPCYFVARGFDGGYCAACYTELTDTLQLKRVGSDWWQGVIVVSRTTLAQSATRIETV